MPKSKLNQNGFAPLIMLLVGVGLLLFIGIAAVGPFQDSLLSSLFPKNFSSAAGNVDLDLVPQNISVAVGETFLVDIAIDAKTVKPTTAQVNIKYDPTVLEAVSFQKGFYFNTDTTQNGPTLITNNTTGIASGLLTVGPEPLGCATLVLNGSLPESQCIFNYKSGSGSIATLQFKALKTTSAPSLIQFDTTNGLTQITALDLTGDQIGTTGNTSVTVTTTPSEAKTSRYSLRPATQNVNIANEFIVDVMLDSRSEAANTFSAKLNFDPAKLEVVSVDTSDSFITQWITANSFDNEVGRVSLVGGVPDPGHITTAPEVMAKVHFKSKTTGAAEVRFDASSAVYSNISNQDILANSTNATVNITGTLPNPTAAPTSTPTPTVNPTVTPTQTPNPTQASTATPAPSASIIATATPDPEEENPSPEPSPVVCSISSANWVTSNNPVNAGKVVGMHIIGDGECNGETVNLEVFEDDGFLGSDRVKSNPPAPKFRSDNIATSSWIAEFQDDGLLGIGNPPEYYFTASYDGVGIRSEDPDLLVNNAGSGGPILEGDVNRDGRVDLIDLSIMFSNWNKESDYPDGLDLLEDNKINTLDATVMLHILVANGVIQI